MNLKKVLEHLDNELDERKVPNKHPGLKSVSAKKGEDIGKKGKKFKEGWRYWQKRQEVQRNRSKSS